LSATLIDALALPGTAGVKVTLILQVLFAGSDVGQLLLWAKSLASGPVISIDAMLSGRLPLLVRVTACGLLVAPTLSLPKLTLVGENVTNGALLTSNTIPQPELQ
jgi:hypothetical protein